MNHLQDLKNVTKTIFNGSKTNLVQNRILKKKSCQICPKILKIPHFLNFPKLQNGRKLPESADNYPKTSTLPQSLTKKFFVLNVVFAGFDAA